MRNIGFHKNHLKYQARTPFVCVGVTKSCVLLTLRRLLSKKQDDSQTLGGHPIYKTSAKCLQYTTGHNSFQKCHIAISVWDTKGKICIHVHSSSTPSAITDYKYWKFKTCQNRMNTMFNAVNKKRKRIIPYMFIRYTPAFKCSTSKIPIYTYTICSRYQVRQNANQKYNKGLTWALNTNGYTCNASKHKCNSFTNHFPLSQFKSIPTEQEKVGL